MLAGVGPSVACCGVRLVTAVAELTTFIHHTLVLVVRTSNGYFTDLVKKHI